MTSFVTAGGISFINVETVNVAKADDPERQERLQFLAVLESVFGLDKINAATINRMQDEAASRVDEAMRAAFNKHKSGE